MNNQTDFPPFPEPEIEEQAPKQLSLHWLEISNERGVQITV